MEEIFTVLIFGSGQIGSRHLQGLARCSHSLRIYVVDINTDSLQVARQRWNEVLTGNVCSKVISYHSSLEGCPKKIDLVIHATSAKGRLDLIAQIKRHAFVHYWILEKVLVQSSAELGHLLELFDDNSRVWVNLPRRGLKWHALIRDSISRDFQLHLKVYGKAWGLACNSIHFLDMLAWFSGESLVRISTDGLSKEWIMSKRHGNREITGEILAEFSGGSTATLSVERGESTNLCYELELQNGEFIWHIDEESGVAVRSDGLSIPGRLPYQSEVTPFLVDRILSMGRCQLPTLAVSAEIHRVFLDAMLSHFRKTVDSAATCVPIT